MKSDGINIWSDDLEKDEYILYRNMIVNYVENNYSKLYNLVDNIYIIHENNNKDLPAGNGGLFSWRNRNIKIRADKNVIMNLTHEFSHAKFRYINKAKFENWDSFERVFLDEFLAYRTVEGVGELDIEYIKDFREQQYEMLIYIINNNTGFTYYEIRCIGLILAYDFILEKRGYLRKIQGNEFKKLEYINYDIKVNDIKFVKNIIEIVYKLLTYRDGLPK